MRALVATGNPQTPLEMREVDEPSPGPGESEVEVRAVFSYMRKISGNRTGHGLQQSRVESMTQP